MNTAEALASITDSGKFELLATAVLRLRFKELETIIHTGVSSTGQTRRSPVDAFAKVPMTDPPYFVLVEHTITDTERLSIKWLYDKDNTTTPEGDLIKAYKLSREILGEVSNAHFKVILTTNQRPPLNLIREVNAKAEEYQIEVEVLEQSFFADYLDNTDEGHWIRYKYLGIKDERLSKNRLVELCKESIVLYERTHLFTSSDQLIHRKEERLLEQKLIDREKTIFFLIGESGLGKSSVAILTLKNQLENGHYGMWIPPEYIDKSVSWENLLNEYFLTLYPHIEPSAGKKALELIREQKSFFIVIDDINRINNPANVLNKVINWTIHRNKDNKDVSSQITVICPVWQQNVGSISHFLGKKWLDVSHINVFTPEEGKEVIQSAYSRIGTSITDIRAESYVKDLGHDPFMIGLFCEEIQEKKFGDESLKNEAIVDCFIKSCIDDLIDTEFLQSDYLDALSTLTSKMLQERKINPSWEDIQSWFQSEDMPRKIHPLKVLINQGKLCRLSSDSSRNVFQFRHDRIKEFFMIQNIIDILKTGELTSDIIFDPYYAKFVARALLSVPQNREFLEELVMKSPLVLINALRYMNEPYTSFESKIIDQLHSWSKSVVGTCERKGNMITDNYIAEVVFAAGWILAEIDSPLVLEVTEHFSTPARSLVDLARFRNGCTDSGIRYCSLDEELQCTDSLRDQIMEQAKENHRDKLAIDLSNKLTEKTTDMNKLKASLLLVGFLGLSELETELITCWNLTDDKTKILPYMLWVALRCCREHLEKVANPLIQYWNELSDEKDSKGKTEIQSVIEPLVFALTRVNNDRAIQYLIDKAMQYKKICWPIKILLGPVDLPESIEYLIREGARIKNSLEGEKSFSPWVESIGDEWNPRLRRGRKLSANSMERLKSLWENRENDKHIKQLAFKVWLMGIDRNSLEDVKNAQKDTHLFHRALLKRVELADTTSIPEFCKLLKNSIHWVDKTIYIWSNTAKETIDEIIKSSEKESPFANFYFSLSRLAMKLPKGEAEQLLGNNWDQIGSNPLMIQSALYVGTKKCLKLAKVSIKDQPKPKSIFKHIASRFGTHSIESEKYLTKEKLEYLVPYLQYLDPFDIFQFGDHCQRIGIPEWSRDYIYDFMEPKYQKQLHPTDDQLLEELLEILKNEKRFGQIFFWTDEFEKRKDSKERMFKILVQLLEHSTTLNSIRLISLCLQFKGSRSDLRIFDRDFPESLSKKVDNIKKGTKLSVWRKTLE